MTFKNASPEQILKFFFEKYGNYRVMRFFKHPQKWFVIDKTYFEQSNDWRLIHEPNQRQIMPDELVFDIDVEEHNQGHTEDGLKLAKIITERLEQDNISYSVWFSGGSGYHIHAFFPELMNYTKPQRKLFKELLLKHYGRGFLKTTLPAHVCLAPKTLIQLENAFHRRLKGVKKFEFGKDTTDTFDNKIPEELVKKFEKIKNHVKLIIRKPFLADGQEPACIKFILSNDFLSKKDGRKRALFILTSYYKKIGLSDAEIIQRLVDWNNYSLNNYLSMRSIKSTVKSSEGRVGCHYVRNFLSELNINLCDKCNQHL